jgi:hypothetical protein
MFGTGIDLAVGLFLVTVFANYVGIVKRAEKAFTWIAAGAVSFLLAGVFNAAPMIGEWVTTGTVNYGYVLFGVVGFILVLVGALWAIYQLLVE